MALGSRLVSACPLGHSERSSPEASVARRPRLSPWGQHPKDFRRFLTNGQALVLSQLAKLAIFDWAASAAEHHFTVDVFRFHVPVASHPKRMVK
jgi:hypothetical protein